MSAETQSGQGGATSSETLAPFSRRVPLVVAAALFIEFLDSTIVATALPTIAREMGVPAHSLSLAITVYLVSLSVLVPASGWIADKFGARRVLVSALCVFLMGSVVSGSSTSLLGLLCGRALQGAAGALMMPVGRLIVLKTVPRRQLMQAWVWLTMPALLGPLLGPPVGGLIVTAASWRWIFWVNIPIGLAGILAAALILPPIREDRVPPFDRLGFFLSATAIACGVFALEILGRAVLPWWSSLILVALSSMAIAAYLRHARTHPNPIVDISLFSVPTFRLSILGGSIFRIAVGAAPFLIPLQLQVGFGQSALRSGLTTFVGALGAMAVKPVVTPLIHRFGFRPMLTTNALIGAMLMAAVAAVTQSTPIAVLLLLLFSGGFFRSLEFTTIASISYSDVERDRMSRATTVAGMMQQISMSFGVATAAGLLHVVPAVRGVETASATDYSIAIFCVGVLSASSAIVFYLLPTNAGADLLAEQKQA